MSIYPTDGETYKHGRKQQSEPEPMSMIASSNLPVSHDPVHRIARFQSLSAGQYWRPRTTTPSNGSKPARFCLLSLCVGRFSPPVRSRSTPALVAAHARADLPKVPVEGVEVFYGFDSSG